MNHSDAGFSWDSCQLRAKVLRFAKALIFSLPQSTVILVKIVELLWGSEEKDSQYIFGAVYWGPQEDLESPSVEGFAVCKLAQVWKLISGYDNDFYNLG